MIGGRRVRATFSLERRLMRRLSLILAGSFLLFTVVYLFFIQNDAVFHASEAVGETARDMAASIHQRADGSAAFSVPELNAIASWPKGSAYAAISVGSEQPVAGSDPALLAELTHRSPAELVGGRVLDTDGIFSVLSVTLVEQAGHRYRIAVLRPLTTADVTRIGLVHEFAEEILPCFLPALLLAALVTWLTLRANLRPLRRASLEAGAVGADNPGQRMSTDNLASEIRPMIDAVNRALSRLEDALSAQRRFTANAAHELRTPLAVLRSRVDSMDPGAMHVTLARDIDRMTRAVSQMLLTSRVQAGGTGEMAPVDLAALVRDVVADLAPLAHSRGRDIALAVLSRPVVHGSAMALESATRNLIENALRFAPLGTAVCVEVGPGPALSVTDHGTGIDDADKLRIFEPFWRAQAQQSDGAGLGLAIVREVAELHEGRVSVEDAPGGGALFRLILPKDAHGHAASMQLASPGHKGPPACVTSVAL